MEERYKILTAVYLILIRDNPNNVDKKQILLQKRQNTGYMDNMYDACGSGHLETNESVMEAVQREAEEEEACITINKEDLKLVTIYHAGNSSGSLEYLRFYFESKVWSGEPKIGEPDKCSEMIWVNIDNLSENTISHLKVAIKNYLNGVNYAQDEF